MWPTLVDVMNCIRRLNSYITSFTYSLEMAAEVHAETSRGLCCVCRVLIFLNGHEVSSRVGYHLITLTFPGSIFIRLFRTVHLFS